MRIFSMEWISSRDLWLDSLWFMPSKCNTPHWNKAMMKCNKIINCYNRLVNSWRSVTLKSGRSTSSRSVDICLPGMWPHLDFSSGLLFLLTVKICNCRSCKRIVRQKGSMFHHLLRQRQRGLRRRFEDTLTMLGVRRTMSHKRSLTYGFQVLREVVQRCHLVSQKHVLYAFQMQEMQKICTPVKGRVWGKYPVLC